MAIPNNFVKFDLNIEIAHVDIQDCEMTLEFPDENNPL